MADTKKRLWDDRVALIEDLIGGVFLLALAVVPIFEIILRKISGSGLVWSTGFLTHVVVWVAWVGGITASREGVHLSLSSSAEPEGRFWKNVEIVKGVAVTAVNMAFAIASASFLVRGFGPGETVGVLPIRLILIILPIGYLSMSLRALWRPHKKASPWLALGLFLGIVFSWVSIVNLLEVVFPDLPFAFYDSQEVFWNVFHWFRWPLIAALIFLGVRGLPIYVMLGGTALFLFSGNWGMLATLPNEAYNMLTGNMIPAIPLFTVTGYLLSETSSGKRLVRFFRAALGWLPGGLAVVAVVACAYFTTFTGASGVTILAIGGLLASVLVESKQYGKDFSRGLITSSGSVGLLFPPALPIIMYGVVAQISIKDMFLGGLLPGILLVVALSSMGIVRAVRNKNERIPFVVGDFFSSLKGATSLSAAGRKYLSSSKTS